MNTLAALSLILLACGLLGVVGCCLAKGLDMLVKARGVWSRRNKRHLEHYPARWRPTIY